MKYTNDFPDFEKGCCTHCGGVPVWNGRGLRVLRTIYSRVDVGPSVPPRRQAEVDQLALQITTPRGPTLLQQKPIGISEPTVTDRAWLSSHCERRNSADSLCRRSLKALLNSHQRILLFLQIPFSISVTIKNNINHKNHITHQISLDTQPPI